MAIADTLGECLEAMWKDMAQRCSKMFKTWWTFAVTPHFLTDTQRLIPTSSFPQCHHFWVEWAWSSWPTCLDEMKSCRIPIFQAAYEEQTPCKYLPLVLLAFEVVRPWAKSNLDIVNPPAVQWVFPSVSDEYLWIPVLYFPWIPSGQLTQLLKMVRHSCFTHWNGWLSIVIVVYQRVSIEHPLNIGLSQAIDGMDLPTGGIDGEPGIRSLVRRLMAPLKTPRINDRSCSDSNLRLPSGSQTWQLEIHSKWGFQQENHL